jgi:hypothetical protein
LILNIRYKPLKTQQFFFGNTTVLGKVTCFDPLYGVIIRPYIILRIVKYINCFAPNGIPCGLQVDTISSGGSIRKNENGKGTPKMCHIPVILMGRSCSVGRWVFYWLSLRVGALVACRYVYMGCGHYWLAILDSVLCWLSCPRIDGWLGYFPFLGRGIFNILSHTTEWTQTILIGPLSRNINLVSQRSAQRKT